MSPRRTPWHERRDAQRLRALLDEIRERGNLTRACEETGLGVRFVQKLRQRDEGFAVEFREANAAWMTRRSSRRYRYRPRTGPPFRC